MYSLCMGRYQCHMVLGQNILDAMIRVLLSVVAGSLSGDEEYRLSYKYLLKTALSRCSDKAPSSVHTLYMYSPYLSI